MYICPCFGDEPTGTCIAKDYRPLNMQNAVRREGKLPILLFANGGCMDTSVCNKWTLAFFLCNRQVMLARHLAHVQYGVADTT